MEQRIRRLAHAVGDQRPKAGGKFSYRMEAKDNEVKAHERIVYTLGDGRKVNVTFSPEANATKVTETFEAEQTNSPEMQKGGWQAILDNFKKYVESNNH